MIMENDFMVACVAVIFNEKGEILLAQREQPESLFGHNKWNLPGGGLEFTEDPKDCAIRETEEEVGITIELLSTHPYVYSWISDDRKEQVLILAYPAKYVSGEIDFSKDEGTKDARWFSYKEINFANCLPFTKEIINQVVENK